MIVSMIALRKDFCCGQILIVAARQSGAFLFCRVRWWPARTALSVEGGATAIAFDVHLQDGSVMHEAVDSGERHGVVGEHFAPLAERLIGSDQQAPAAR
jgi:hypothetical protein